MISEFLKEIRDITIVAKKSHGEQAAKREVTIEEAEPGDQNQEDTTPFHSEEEDGDAHYPDDSSTGLDDRDPGCQCLFHSFCNHLTREHSVDAWTRRYNRLRRDRRNSHPPTGR